MTVIKTLGRKEGWRHGAKLVKLPKPIKINDGKRVRQTIRAVACQGYLYPVNRQEQIMGDPIQSTTIL